MEFKINKSAGGSYLPVTEKRIKMIESFFKDYQTDLVKVRMGGVSCVFELPDLVGNNEMLIDFYPPLKKPSVEKQLREIKGFLFKKKSKPVYVDQDKLFNFRGW